MKVLVLIIVLVVSIMWYVSHEQEDKILKFQQEHECDMIARIYHKTQVDIVCHDGKILHYVKNNWLANK